MYVCVCVCVYIYILYKWAYTYVYICTCISHFRPVLLNLFLRWHAQKSGAECKYYQIECVLYSRVQVLSNGTVQSNFEKFCLHRFEHCQIRSLQRTGSRRGRGSCRRRRAAWDRWTLPLRLLQLFVVVVLSAGLWVCVDLCVWGLGLVFSVYVYCLVFTFRV